MRWKICGSDKNDGKTREIWVEALTRDEAIAKANDLQIMVSSAAQDLPITINSPSNFKLDKRQIKKINATEMRIASGVFIGMSFFFIFWGLVFLAFMIWGFENSFSSN